MRRGSGLSGQTPNTVRDGNGYEGGDNFSLYNSSTKDLEYNLYWDEPGLSSNNGAIGNITGNSFSTSFNPISPDADGSSANPCGTDKIFEFLTAPVPLSSAVRSQAIDDSQLFQNKPNPFRQSTVIPYKISGRYTMAKIKVFDVLGQQIMSKDLTPEEGFSEIEFSLSNLSPGIYAYGLFLDGSLFDVKLFIKE